MKKRFVLMLVLIIVAGVTSLNADWRLDIGGVKPFAIGIESSTFSGYADFMNAGFFMLPELNLHYIFLGEEGSFLQVGAGVKSYFFIVEGIGTLDAYAEFNLDPIIVHLNIGGGFMFFYGLVNDIVEAAVIMPELFVAVKLFETVDLGVGVLYFTTSANFMTEYVYFPYFKLNFPIYF